MHHLDSWIKRDQLDVTCFFITLFNAQHVSDVNTSILRSLRLICRVISWVVLLWFDVCWCYGVVSGCRLKHWCFSLRQWSRGLRRGSTAARLLGLWVRILLGSSISVCVECCVLSGRCLCNGLITRPEMSYRLWCVVVCDAETSRMRRPWPALGCRATGKRKIRGTESVE